MPAVRSSRWRTALVALPLLLLTAAARGQFSASVLAESDYRFRGVSLSDEDPDLHLSLAYDHASGWYAGASATGVELEPRQRDAELLGYLGYAQRPTGPGTRPAWELGAAVAHFAGAAHYDYLEVYAGVLEQRWNARLYYSPDYFGRGVRTAYAELNGGWPLAPTLRAFGHAGALLRLAGPAPPGAQRWRYDTRVGLSLAVDACELQLAWVWSSRGGPYPAAYEHKRSAVVLSASYFF